MKRQLKTWNVWVLCAALLLFAQSAAAQANSNAAGVNLNAVLNPQLTVNASPATVNFTLPPGGTDTGDSPVTISTRWILPFGYSFFFANVSLWAYFTSPAAALSNGAGNNIPAARVSGSLNGGAFAPFTTAGPFSPASRQIFSQGVFTIPPFSQGQRTDSLNLQIDTSGLGLPAGIYTGVLVIQARAI
ncbi:MAG: hypothetical protein ACRD5F_00920 [Candidatus Acidiferrales bacterium]